MTKTKTKAAEKPPEIEFFYDIPQRSEEWFDLRRGIPTASKFAAVMAQGKNGDESQTRQGYMNELVGEIISGLTEETFRSEAMRRGVAMEPIARDYYASKRFDEVVEIAFARRRLPSGRFIGASPDAQVGGRAARKGLEIKSVKQAEMVALRNAAAGGFPPRFKWQLHGTLLVTGWEEIDLLVYSENMGGLEFTIVRDEHKCRELHDALEVFDYDLHDLVRRTREGMA